MSIFSKNLKYLREKRNLSQNKLAELSNINQTSITRWEKDEVSPSLDNVYDIAQALHVSVADLAGRDLTLEDYENEITIEDKTLELYDQVKDKMSEDTRETIDFLLQKEINKNELKKNE